MKITVDRKTGEVKCDVVGQVNDDKLWAIAVVNFLKNEHEKQEEEEE